MSGTSVISGSGTLAGEKSHLSPGLARYKAIDSAPPPPTMSHTEITELNPADVNNRGQFVIAFVNCASGGKQGQDLKGLLETALDDHGLVVDLGDPDSTVRNGVKFPYGALEGRETDRLVMLSCGGDGTHHWVFAGLAAFYGKAMSSNGLVVLPVPLGSGNDLSNALGWGQSISLSEIPALVAGLGGATEHPMDRWSVKFSTERTRQHHTGAEFQWQNYLSLGFDAEVSHEFEGCRQCCPDCCFSAKCINQFWYAMVGLPKVCNCCFRISSRARFWAKDSNEAGWSELDIPSGTQAVVLLNIASYGAGINMWSPEEAPGSSPEMMSDGLVEVVAVSGPCNFVCGRIGCCGFHRVCQAAFVKMEVFDSVCFQADGEGWLEQVSEPVTVEVSHHSTVQMLTNR